MAPNPDLIFDIDPSEAGSEIVRNVVLPWSGQSMPLRIPAGLSDGTVLRLPGIGPATTPGGPPRDAYVQVRIVPGGGGAVPPQFGAVPPPTSAPPTTPFGAGPYAPPPTSAPPTTPFGAGPYAPPPTSAPPTTPFGAGPYAPPTSAPPTTPFGAGPPGPPGTPPYGGPSSQFGAFPPPQPARGSGRGKLLVIVGGAVALVLLIALAVPLLLWVNNRDGGGKTATGNPSGGSSPSAAPISGPEYQTLLAEVDKAVTPAFTKLGGAKNPKAVGSAVDEIETALNQQIEALSTVVPPANAATAHADLLRGLEGLGDSLAETGSAAGAGEVCLGPAALARLSREAAADDVRTAQQALASADPAQPYQVGNFVPKKTTDTNRRLGNGTFLKRVRSGQGQLKIENGGSTDAVINLVLGSAKTPTVSVYVRAKGKLTVSSIKDGTYRIYMTAGKDWNARAKGFGRDCSFQRFEDTFKFSTSSSSYTIWTITLTPVAGGNARTSEVDPGAFPGS